MALSKIDPQLVNVTQYGYRNLVHNGGFDIWQRGLTVTNAAIDTYTVDRWKQWASSGAESGRATYSKQIITDLEGFAHALKIAVTTAQTSIGATDAYQLQTRLEKKDVDHIGIGTASAKPFTISFYAKASSGFKLAVQVGTYGGGQYLEEFDVTTSWQRFEFNIAAQTNATYVTSQTDYTNWSIQTGITLIAGSSRNTATSGVWSATTNLNGTANTDNFFSSTSNELFIAGYQLEVGDAATPFEHKPVNETLRDCQRYNVTYQASGNPLGTSETGIIRAGGTRSNLGQGSAHNSGNPVTFITLPVPMRAMPSLEYSAAADFAFDRGWSGTAVYSNFQTQGFRSSFHSIGLIGTTSGLSNGDAGALSFEDSTNGWMRLKAEY
jgi:hypothetical protein